MSDKIARRSFLSFFLVSGLFSFFSKKVKAEPEAKKAMFWRRKNES